ncbi:hypothetical protein ScPMuIL_004793 [Solemya velum]
MAEKHSFGVTPITCHTWNGDRSQVCLSLNNSDVKIYKKNGQSWAETATLVEHGQRVTSIDWAPQTNRIVTCGADRNAYVWSMVEGKWKPSLVLLRINRSATFVQFSPKENKFAVGSGARLISICYFESENNWWVSKHIKKPIRSTVSCLDWHPNNILLAAGSTDFKARVFSAYIKDVEEKPSPTSWGSKMTFGNLMAEFSNGEGGWVHSVAFSASGDKLAWTGHDSSLSVANAASGQTLNVVKGNFLPLFSTTWVTENSLVVVGFDCVPKLFSLDDRGALTFISDLDQPKEKESQKSSARAIFQSRDQKDTTEIFSYELKTQHQNTITQVSVYSGTRSNCSKFSTSGVDGNIVVWDFKSLEGSIGGLRIK